MANFKNETEFRAAVLKELRKIPRQYWWKNNIDIRQRRSCGDPGMPDLTGIVRGGKFAGLELKMPGGELRKSQEIWHARAIELGAEIFVTDDLHEAIKWAVRL